MVIFHCYVNVHQRVHTIFRQEHLGKLTWKRFTSKALGGGLFFFRLCVINDDDDPKNSKAQPTRVAAAISLRSPRKQSTFGCRSGMPWRIQRDTGFSSVRLGVQIDFFPSTSEKKWPCPIPESPFKLFSIMKQLKDGADYYLTKLSSHKNIL